MKKIMMFLVFAVLMFLISCGGSDSGSGGISGYITEATSGEPIANAKVVLEMYFENQAAVNDYFNENEDAKFSIIGESILTGSDGMFEFIDLTSGIYVISVSKDGYEYEDKDVDSYWVTVKDKIVRYNIQLREHRSWDGDY